jgi:predicted ATPase/DNA-binding SARP family transcriptional activator
VASLSLSLLGPFGAILGDQVLTKFRSNKVQALLIYLCVEPPGIHRREGLMALLWPGLPQRSAQANLRQTLYLLRKVIPEIGGAPLLLSERQTVQRNPEADVALDVARFSELLSGDPGPEHLIWAVELYRGDFLCDFYLPDSDPFEDWAAARRAAYRQEMLEALEALTRHHIQQGAYAQAQAYARRALELDDLWESAHRGLMTALALDGHREAALRQYQACARLLEAELGVGPSTETLALYNALKEGREPILAQDPTRAPIADREDPAGQDPLHGRYRLLGELGRGGMGTVYRAHDTLLERDVAIKVLEGAALGGEGRARLLREARVVAQLSHPNIVTVFDVGESDGNPFIVMELVPGTTLYEQRPDGVDGILAVTRQICAALAHAHGQGIVHRDLKPENVLVAPDGTAKLMDFGLARLVASRLTQEGAIVGTVFYLAPEQAQGGPLDGRADLYALGVMLYELTTGQLPFSGDDPLEVISQHLHAPAVPPRQRNPDLPPALDNLILRLLEKDPQQRPASATEVLQLLEAAAQVERRRLPAPATPFVGREAELTELDRMIADPDVRLITIVGPGGIGKTRLALAAAQRQLGAPDKTDDGQGLRFSDGVVFVTLAALSSPEHILPTVADALGFQAQGGGGDTRTPGQQILAFLRRKRLLLVLDNLEHLLEPPPAPPLGGKVSHPPLRGGQEGGAADLVAEILRAAPAVQILATSRERLNLREEQVYPIQGLEFPDWVAPEDLATYTAAQLFLHSAARVRPHFALETHDIANLTRICQLVGGMPLALELAASWVDTLSLADIAAQISQDFDFLATEWRGVPARHRSVRAAIETSWRQLSPEEQAAFAQLSVFRGGFKRDAAQAVALSEVSPSQSFRILARLVNKSLLTYDQARDRYAVHELLRQYGAEKLADPDAARDRHSAHYCAAVARWHIESQGPREAEALEELEHDLENLRAAWRWAAAQQEIARLDQALDGLWRFFWLRFRLEDIIAAGQLAIEVAGRVGETARDYADAQRVLIRALTRLAGQYIYTARRSLGKTLLERAEKLLDGPTLVGHDTRLERAFLLQARGCMGDLGQEQARRALQGAVSLFRALGDRHEEAWSLTHLGTELAEQRDWKAAIPILEDSLALQQARGDYYGIAVSHVPLARLASYLGDYDLALQHYRDSLAACRAGRNVNESWVLCGMADTHRVRGDHDVSRQLYHAALASARSRGLREFEAVALFGLGAVAMDAYDVKEAGRRFRDGLALVQESEHHGAIGSGLAALGHLSCFQGRFAAGADCLRQSVTMLRTSAQLNDAATVLCNLAFAQMLSGAFDQAQATLREASVVAGEGATPHTRTVHALHQCQLQLYTARYQEAISWAREALRQAAELEGKNRFHGVRDLPIYTPRQHCRTGIIAQGHGLLGWAALAEERYDAAREALCESVPLFQKLGDREYAAWALAGLAAAAWGSGERDEAQAYLLKALETAVEIGAFMPLLHLLPVIALTLAEGDEPGLQERAVELYALAAKQPLVAKGPFFEDVTGMHIRAAAAALPPDVVQAAQRRGRALDGWEAARELLAELEGRM